MTDAAALPNFLIPGAAKCGTTSLYEYLAQHPDVFMPEDKEPNFFIRERIPVDRAAGEVSTFAAYKALYRGSAASSARGDASTNNFFFYERAIPEIKRHVGDVKIIIALRDPVDRAWSQYSSMLLGNQVGSFEECLDREDAYQGDPFEWSNRTTFFQAWSRYCAPVRAYQESFSSVKFVLFDDLIEDPIGTVRSVYRFLGVDDAFEPDTDASYNPSVTPGSPFTRFLVSTYMALRVGPIATSLIGGVLGAERAERLKGRLTTRALPLVSSKPVMAPETRKRLGESFHDEILELQTLIDRDLSGWLRAG